jgi:hypothetical protein
MHLLGLFVHQLEPLVLAPPVLLVDVKLARASTGRRALDVLHHLARWPERGRLRNRNRLVGVLEKSLELAETVGERSSPRSAAHSRHRLKRHEAL